MAYDAINLENTSLISTSAQIEIFTGESPYKNFHVKYFINKNDEEAIRQAIDIREPD